MNLQVADNLQSITDYCPASDSEVIRESNSDHSPSTPFTVDLAAAWTSQVEEFRAQPKDYLRKQFLAIRAAIQAQLRIMKFRVILVAHCVVQRVRDKITMTLLGVYFQMLCLFGGLLSQVELLIDEILGRIRCVRGKLSEGRKRVINKLVKLR